MTDIEEIAKRFQVFADLRLKLSQIVAAAKIDAPDAEATARAQIGENAEQER